MRIISINVNGLRAAARKGFFQWLATQQADVVCLQETRMQPEDLAVASLLPSGWQAWFNPAARKGYSGVAVFSPHPPDAVASLLQHPHFDTEGRYLELRFGALSVASVYLPSGSSSAERQALKFEFMAHFRERLRACREDGRDYILCGDWNIAHKEIDLRNWKGNQKNSGFLPEERAWMGHVFEELGWVDAFRVVDPRPDQYTWWSNRGQARAKNVGWRIDYQVVTPALRSRIVKASIYTGEWFSDHAPLTIDYQGGLG
jgi:exodeoxyribonuclease III